MRSPAQESLLEDGCNAGLTREAIVRLVEKECPLAFKDKAQYNDFCGCLAICVKEGIWKFRKLKSTEAALLSGFQIIIGGTAATLYSETPSKFGRVFDQNGKGQSDLDVTIVFEGPLDRDRMALAEAIFSKRVRAVHISLPSNMQCPKYTSGFSWKRKVFLSAGDTH